MVSLLCFTVSAGSTVAQWAFVLDSSFWKAVGQALVNVNSVQLIPVVSVHALSLSAWGGQRNGLRSFNSIGVGFTDFFL